MFKHYLCCLFATLITISLSGEVVITFQESGNDVVSIYSGTLDTDDPNINDISELSRFASKFNPSLGYYANPPGGWRTIAASRIAWRCSSCIQAKRPISRHKCCRPRRDVSMRTAWPAFVRCCHPPRHDSARSSIPATSASRNTPTSRLPCKPSPPRCVMPS